MVLTDGLNGAGEPLLAGLRDQTRASQRIVGGAAGDEGRFQSTSVGLDGRAGPDAAAIAHLFLARAPGVGFGHGLRAATSRMVATRSSGNVLHEIDGRPAFEAYAAHAKRLGKTLQPQSAGPFLIANELGIYFLDQLSHARAPLSVGPRGELNLAAPVAEGSDLCILDGEPDALVAACGQAALQARAQLEGRPAAGVLVFDCVCRGLILGSAFQREIDAIQQVFPGVPVAGLLTYGEIARVAGATQPWHNTTSVVVALPA